MVGMNGVHIAIGYALASYMGLAFYYAEDPATQWRAPLGIALIWPVLVIVVCFIVPESPRYLLMKGRIEEARTITYKLHHMSSDPDDEFARGEFYQMAKQAEIDRKLDPGWVSHAISVACGIADFRSSKCSDAQLTASASSWRCPSLSSVNPQVRTIMFITDSAS